MCKGRCILVYANVIVSECKSGLGMCVCGVAEAVKEQRERERESEIAGARSE